MRNGIMGCLLVIAIGACSEPETMPDAEADAARAALEEALPAPEETVTLTFRVEDAQEPVEDIASAVDHRLRSLGMGSAEALAGDPPRLVCQVRDGDPAHRFRVIGVITTRGRLAFWICAPEREIAVEKSRRSGMGAEYRPPGPSYRWLESARDDTWGDVLVIVPEPGSTDDFTARDVASAEPRPADGEDGWLVHFEFVEERKQAFHDFTARHIGRRIAIVIDGALRSAPIIRSPLPGFGVIEGGAGGMSKDEAHGLALILGIRRAYDATLVLESAEEPGTE
jgi:preprotein translocase subunit SecD